MPPARLYFPPVSAGGSRETTAAVCERQSRMRLSPSGSARAFRPPPRQVRQEQSMQRVERNFAGRRLVIETGRMAKQAAGAAVVQFGETMVLATVTVSDTQSSLPFFPLTVEYKEKSYAAGKIPGGFIKREGRPHDAEI